MLDTYRRYQAGLNLEDLFPLRENVCSCGCNTPLPIRRKKWASDNCRKKALQQFYIVKGDTSVIRDVLFQLDQGHCRNCGSFDENWQADHIIPVSKGGGACSIDNFQTLCIECHKEKTFLNAIPDIAYRFTPCFNVVPTYSSTGRTLYKIPFRNVV